MHPEYCRAHPFCGDGVGQAIGDVLERDVVAALGQPIRPASVMRILLVPCWWHKFLRAQVSPQYSN
jgi:hypothetical protein